MITCSYVLCRPSTSSGPCSSISCSSEIIQFGCESDYEMRCINEMRLGIFFYSCPNSLKPGILFVGIHPSEDGSLARCTLNHHILLKWILKCNSKLFDLSVSDLKPSAATSYFKCCRFLFFKDTT
ncbi:uncharacterized protein LOC113361989 [Papaver somniferum]|uniref:uncharacterized protein LOC113361989 n=1 Tax=Papaver somniferum TaxID=3469 RepID=UPI000E6FE6E4|nr:uncharacterized protein LOC113361989 [Papaver somniferum]